MVRVHECAGCTLYARRAYRLCKGLGRRLLGSMDGGGGAREAAAAALETEQRLRDLGYGQDRIAAVDNDKVGGVTNRHAIMRGIHQPRRQRRDHVETCSETAAPPDFAEFG